MIGATSTTRARFTNSALRFEGLANRLLLVAMKDRPQDLNSPSRCLQNRQRMRQCVGAIFCLFVLTLARGADDIVLSDFEGDTYGEWKTTGDAFGSGPAHGALPHQQKVDGYDGNGLADSYHGGDSATGTLSSPKFKIERKYINFLIGPLPTPCAASVLAVWTSPRST